MRSFGSFSGAAAAALAAAWLGTAAAAEVAVGVRDGLYTVEAENAPLGEIVRALAERAGLECRLYGNLSRPVTAQIESLTLVETLQRLGAAYGIVYRRGPGEEPVPVSLALLQDRRGPSPAPRWTRTLEYGKDPQGVGVLDRPETERRGPESFAVGPDGSVYLCDTVNGRILVVPPAPGALREFPVPGTPVDVACSEDAILVLEGRTGALLSYAPDGTLRAEQLIPPDVLRERMSLESGPDGPFIRTRDGEERLLDPARKPPVSSLPAIQARIGKGGTALISWSEGTDRREAVFRTGRILSVAPLGRDGGGNLYIQVERAGEGGSGVDLGVMKLSPEGAILDSLDRIPNNYGNWTARLLALGPGGEVCQVLPGPDRVAVNCWNWRRKTEEPELP